MTPERSALLVTILADPGRVHELDVEEAAVLLAQVAAVQASLAARVASAARSVPASRRQDDDRLISVDEAAARLGVTPRWLYRHSGHLPFARRLSRKTLRFSDLGLKRWQATRSA